MKIKRDKFRTESLKVKMIVRNKVITHNLWYQVACDESLIKKKTAEKMSA